MPIGRAFAYRFGSTRLGDNFHRSFVPFFCLTHDPSSPPHFSRLRNQKQNTLLQVGDYSTSVGFLGFPYQTNDANSVSEKVDELSTMLTAGRLSAENKQVILVRFIK